MNLGEIPVPDGLDLIYSIDADMLDVYGKAVRDGALHVPSESVLRSLKNDRRIFLCGCGATGRLSIQLEALWRGFWNRLEQKKTHFRQIGAGNVRYA